MDRRGRVRGRSDAVLTVVTNALESLAAGRDPRQLVCSQLGRQVDAEAAAWILVRDGAQAQMVSPSPARHVPLLATAGRQLLAGPSGIGRRPVVRELVLTGVAHAPVHRSTACLPLQVTGTSSSALVFLCRHGFAEDAVALLTSAQRSLAPLDALVGGSSENSWLHGTDGLGLTPREREVLLLLADGLLARTIAASLCVSPRTVHHHLGRIYAKLGVRDRLGAVLRARSEGLLVDPARAEDQSLSAPLG